MQHLHMLTWTHNQTLDSLPSLYTKCCHITQAVEASCFFSHWHLLSSPMGTSIVTWVFKFPLCDIPALLWVQYSECMAEFRAAIWNPWTNLSFPPQCYLNSFFPYRQLKVIHFLFCVPVKRILGFIYSGFCEQESVTLKFLNMTHGTSLPDPYAID